MINTNIANYGETIITHKMHINRAQSINLLIVSTRRCLTLDARVVIRKPYKVFNFNSVLFTYFINCDFCQMLPKVVGDLQLAAVALVVYSHNKSLLVNNIPSIFLC